MSAALVCLTLAANFVLASLVLNNSESPVAVFAAAVLALADLASLLAVINWPLRSRA